MSSDGTTCQEAIPGDSRAHICDLYQDWTRSTAIHPGSGAGSTVAAAYLILGLGGEAGEAASKILDHLRSEQDRLLRAGVKDGPEGDAQGVAITNLGNVINALHYFVLMANKLEELKRPLRIGSVKLPDMEPIGDSAGLSKELGDVAWYLARLSDELGFKLSDILSVNVAKLEDRKTRGVVHGSGDSR
jgi:NTP pyrophosphatase (non-canonical NTP hydrolase)